MVEFLRLGTASPALPFVKPSLGARIMSVGRFGLSCGSVYGLFLLDERPLRAGALGRSGGVCSYALFLLDDLPVGVMGRSRGA